VLDIGSQLASVLLLGRWTRRSSNRMYPALCQLQLMWSLVSLAAKQTAKEEELAAARTQVGAAVCALLGPK
jgi:hypothetical protein